MDIFLIYAAITAISLLLALLMVAMGMHGFDFGHHMDIGSHGHIGDHGHATDGHNSGPSLLSPLMIAVFLTTFGVAGLIMEASTTWNHGLIAAAATFVGLPVYYGAWKGFNSFAGATYGEVSQQSLVGTTGVCTITITPGETGEVVVNSPSGRRTYPARCKDSVNPGSSVTVIQDNGVYLVVE